jgi:ATP-dependent helicase HepA
MQEFIPGQRWISDAELQMGLGTVLTSDVRTVTLLFLATGETRIYAKHSAPLTRVVFVPGDSVLTHEGWSLKIEAVRDEQGLLTYVGRKEDGRRIEAGEGELNNFIQLNRPADRLLSGQVDSDKWFELRYQTLRHINRLAHSDLRGLTGSRTSLIPHQLYIAHEVANRYAPRVLLADEVGLGKTIEAGLILHHQLLTERAKRVLVVVPESLLHQWLVEMMRRFNLWFSLFDEQRCLAVEESTALTNPFHSEQLVLCSLGFLVTHQERFQQALAGDWDLLVVDEAHHLQWSPQGSSIEYQRIEQLAATTRGVLLLTATPEQLGKAGHFARLRLLDPDRFPDYNTFISEERSYEPIAQAVEVIMTDQPIDDETARIVFNTIGEGDNQHLLDILQDAGNSASEKSLARLELVEHLLDRHGTGRVLFRNTRAAVKGFPRRSVIPYPLPLPEAYADCLEGVQNTGISEPHRLLSPELIYQATAAATQIDWTRIDPRIEWLREQLKFLKPSKVLLITASTDSAIDIAHLLKNQAGIDAALFHEGLNIIERDRAAAWFADQEYGAQVLVCSEIGSEGRNFQFAHHLVLFDLPFNPDLLEQRIGRLDRIGQAETIKIHIPYLQNSAQEVMFHWYHQGLTAFEHPAAAGHIVFTQVEETLVEALHQIDDGIEDLPALIATTRKIDKQLNEALQRGRDRLLEYNSCRPHIANALSERASDEDKESNLPDYLERLFDCYGIDSEPHTEFSTIIRPGEQMQTGHFPGLYEEGMSITTQRDIALANEDIHFLSWEHPMATGAMEMVLSSEAGNSAVTAVNCQGIAPGTLLLEALYILEAAPNNKLQTGRYLPPSTLRIVTDKSGNNYASVLTHELIEQSRSSVDRETAGSVITAYSDELRDLIAMAENLAQQQAPELLRTAHSQSGQTLEKEINRLKALQAINPNVRSEEIHFFEKQWQAVTQALEAASFRLDAVRVVVAT